MSDSKIFTYLLISISVLIFLIIIYFICRNRRFRSGYTPFESESALNPMETRLAKSSFYVRSAPNLPSSRQKPEEQDVAMSTPVDFPVFKILHERFRQQVTRSTRKYYEMKESATKPLIEFQIKVYATIYIYTRLLTLVINQIVKLYVINSNLLIYIILCRMDFVFCEFAVFFLLPIKQICNKF